MSVSADAYEKLGQFYLGRGYDMESKQADGDLVLYDSKDLVTHGVVLGMTGSGKTGLCIAMLEEAAMDQVPAIVIDPKGDISNLLLNFPELNGADFRDWVNEDDARKKGLGLDEHAARTAALWKTGLAEWGQSPDRIARLREQADINIFTPGSKAGIPVSILASLEVPPFEILDDAELLGERIESTVASLLALVGVNVETGQSPEAVLLATIFNQTWAAGQNITLETLIRHIQSPSFDKVGVVDLETFMASKTRHALALRFNNLLASPGFSSWLEGAPLDIARMLHAPDGKARISIFSIAHLGDTDRMFFVSLLLNQVLGWMRSQKGTTSLRALLYMDEIFGFLPPTANPPSKRPMMTILKQGRAFGLGALLATQNPVDLDYKALSNIGTWFLGRLQTERDKLRVLDGLEGAAGAQNAKFDRASMERLISGLGNRIFLMNNVHEDGPVLFHVRWVMSYLAGPLTRSQIKTLMDPKRADFLPTGAAGATAAASNPMAMPRVAGSGGSTTLLRPAVGAGVREIFVAPSSMAGAEIVYQPHLYRAATVHFSSARAGVDGSRRIRTLHRFTPTGVDWEHEAALPDAIDEGATQAIEGAGFGELPGFAMNAANYKQVEKDFSEMLYRNERAEVFCCPSLKIWSKLGESEGDFRARLTHAAHEARDAAIEKLRTSMSKKIQTLEGRLRTAEGQLAKEKAEANSAKMQAGMSMLGGLLGSLMGRKGGLGSITRGTTAINKASGAFKQHQDVSTAAAKVTGIQEDIAGLQAELETEVTKITSAYDPAALTLETESIKPSRTDVKIDVVALLWLPFDARGDRA